MEKIKTTINVNSELWKKFSHLVIEEKGYRKKNNVIENLLETYVKNKESKSYMNINKAIILAAGIGSRLRPLTNDLPKCLLKLNSITILEHQIKNLKECGIHEIIIVVGHKSNKIKAFLKKDSLDIKIIKNKDYFNTNNLFSLWLAKDYFEDGFICINSDVIFDINILKQLLRSEGDICLAVDKKECNAEDMKVKVNDIFIKKIGKRLDNDEIYGEFIGISKFTKQGVNSLIQAFSEISLNMIKKSYLANIIQKIINDDHKIHMIEINRKFWTEIDFIEDLNEIKSYFVNKTL